MWVAPRPGRNGVMLDTVATDAIRSGSPEKLEASIRHLLNGPEYAGLREDWRDLLVALAPLHDCARRLGFYPVAVFPLLGAGQRGTLTPLRRPGANLCPAAIQKAWTSNG